MEGAEGSAWPLFEFCAGSVMGTRHHRERRNNQDACAVVERGKVAVAVVADGCGSAESPSSELGALYGARFVADDLALALSAVPDYGAERALGFTHARLLSNLYGLASALGSPLPEMARRHLLFTLLGAIVTPDVTTIFALGDGVYAVNGQVSSLRQPGINAPPYIGQNLIGEERAKRPDDLAAFRILSAEATAGVATLMVGTDGVEDLISALTPHDGMPARAASEGPFSRFWQDDEYYRDPSVLTNRLRALNTERRNVDWERQVVRREPGLMPDDATFICARRLGAE
jgi:hypothetical protein